MGVLCLCGVFVSVGYVYIWSACVVCVWCVYMHHVGCVVCVCVCVSVMCVMWDRCVCMSVWCVCVCCV